MRSFLNVFLDSVFDGFETDTGAVLEDLLYQQKLSKGKGVFCEMCCFMYIILTFSRVVGSRVRTTKARNHRRNLS